MAPGVAGERAARRRRRVQLVPGKVVPASITVPSDTMAERLGVEAFRIARDAHAHPPPERLPSERGVWTMRAIAFEAEPPAIRDRAPSGDSRATLPGHRPMRR